jgi:hypothetical protein
VFPYCEPIRNRHRSRVGSLAEAGRDAALDWNTVRPRAGLPVAAHRRRVEAILTAMPNRPLAVFLAALALLAASVTVLLAPRWLPGLRPPRPAAPLGLPSLTSIAAWHNSAPLGPDSLKGHPVALLLWTDTDPRALAALNVAEAWHRAYASCGIRVIAVHEPEYAFASDTAIAAGIARRLGLTLPIADDARGLVETAIGGTVDGPHLIIADESGQIDVDTVGVLSAGTRALAVAAMRMRPGRSAPPEVDTALPGGVREVQLGAGRVEGGPLRALAAGHAQVFTAEFRYQESGSAWVPYPVGGWRTGAEGITATRGGAANFLAIRYSAGRAGVVVTPPAGGSARLFILRDDRWPGLDERGEDVEAGNRETASVLVTRPGIYWIDKGKGERVLKISPETPGVTVNAFVFTGAR